ncbi:hypothetical protein OS493_010555 [Desmophyllum pertusum]|uniref:Uncharacterized protein n=1 Tax=Desmophyllum pertusum TaxID=174260 RepID=A0A9W9ZQZ3_9CNID|nr:hypothetical protein OS493_010555 [Desmophyllum pertusum]
MWTGVLLKKRLRVRKAIVSCLARILNFMRTMNIKPALLMFPSPVQFEKDARNDPVVVVPDTNECDLMVDVERRDVSPQEGDVETQEGDGENTLSGPPNFDAESKTNVDFMHMNTVYQVPLTLLKHFDVDFESGDSCFFKRGDDIREVILQEDITSALHEV